MDGIFTLMGRMMSYKGQSLILKHDRFVEDVDILRYNIQVQNDLY
jgi:hypothetical protein